LEATNMRPLATLASNHHLTSFGLAVLVLAGCSDDPMPTGIGDPAPTYPGPAFATIGTAPTITHTPVTTAAGDQTDPHISGSRVSYTSNADGTNRIHYHDIATSADARIPNLGEEDFLSDISGSKIVFTRVGATSSIYVYDAGASAAVEVAPSAVANRIDPAIGGSTVAWQDFGFRPSALEPEIVVHDMTTGITTRLTNDALLDRFPAVSPDGNVVVWRKCQATDGTGNVLANCDIWKAVRSAGIWVAGAVTGAEGEETTPDTDGQTITYGSTRSGEMDVFWRPVAGGPEQQLTLTGIQTDPSISEGLITFDSRNAAGNMDVWAYDIGTDIAFPLITTSPNQTLNDVWVSPTGLVRVVYQSDETGDFNIYALSFQRSTGLVCSTAPARDQIKTLLTALHGLSLTPAQRTALLAPLKAAALAIFGGNKPAAIEALQNFMQLVSEPYRTILGSAVGPLLDAAQCAIDRLSGTPPG
jgi:Tol biopolymer transport system component